MPKQTCEYCHGVVSGSRQPTFERNMANHLESCPAANSGHKIVKKPVPVKKSQGTRDDPDVEVPTTPPTTPRKPVKFKDPGTEEWGPQHGVTLPTTPRKRIIPRQPD
jgi:hypothetical protein